MGEKIKIELNRQEVRKEVKKIEKSDYFASLKEQIKKIKSGDRIFRGEAENWQQIIHSSEFKVSDAIRDYLVPNPSEIGDIRIEQLPDFLKVKTEEEIPKRKVRRKKKEEPVEKKKPKRTVKQKKKIEAPEEEKAPKPKKRKRKKPSQKEPKEKKVKAKKPKARKRKSTKTKKKKKTSKPKKKVVSFETYKA